MTAWTKSSLNQPGLDLIRRVVRLGQARDVESWPLMISVVTNAEC